MRFFHKVKECDRLYNGINFRTDNLNDYFTVIFKIPLFFNKNVQEYCDPFHGFYYYDARLTYFLLIRARVRTWKFVSACFGAESLYTRIKKMCLFSIKISYRLRDHKGKQSFEDRQDGIVWRPS